jgi:hypothetical protein
MRALLVQERTSAYVPGFGSMVISVLFRISLPALVKYTSRSTDNHSFKASMQPDEALAVATVWLIF